MFQIIQQMTGQNVKHMILAAIMINYLILIERELDAVLFKVPV